MTASAKGDEPIGAIELVPMLRFTPIESIEVMDIEGAPLAGRSALRTPVTVSFSDALTELCPSGPSVVPVVWADVPPFPVPMIGAAEPLSAKREASSQAVTRAVLRGLQPHLRDEYGTASGTCPRSASGAQCGCSPGVFRWFTAAMAGSHHRIGSLLVSGPSSDARLRTEPIPSAFDMTIVGRVVKRLAVFARFGWHKPIIAGLATF